MTDETEFVDRVLLQFHKPTAEQFLAAWYAALDADIKARREVYHAACQANPLSAGLWELIEQHESAVLAGDDNEAERLDVECGEYIQKHPAAYDPIGATYDEVDQTEAADLDAAYRCVYGEDRT